MNVDRLMLTYKMVRKLKTGEIRVCILEIDDHELLMLVRRQHEGRLISGHHAKDVSILGLQSYLVSTASKMKMCHETHIIVGKDKPLIDSILPTVLLLKPDSVLFDHSPEDRPWNPTN